MSIQYKKSISLVIIFCFMTLSFIQGSATMIHPLNQTIIPPIEPSQNMNQTPKYYALIIGVNESGEQTKNEQSALTVYESLIQGANWKDENICLLVNKNATKQGIQTAIYQWLEPKESSDDIILIYWNCKTEKIPFQDRSVGNIYMHTHLASENSDKISDKELDSWLDTLDSNHLFMIVDTNYAWHMKSLKQKGRTMFMSTGPFFAKKQEGNDNLDSSIVSYQIRKALQGYADRNSDDFIDSDELFSFVKTNSYQYSLIHLKFMFSPPFISLQIPMIYKKFRSNQDLFRLSFGWKQLSDDGFGRHSNYGTRGMEIFHDELYIGTQNNMMPTSINLEQQSFGMTALTGFTDLYSMFGRLSRIPVRIAVHLLTLTSQGCEIWKYNYDDDSLIKVIGKDGISGISAGFGSHYNAAASVIKEFNGYLYVGTWNTPIGGVLQPNRKGCEIWRTADGVHWEQVVGHQAPFMIGGFGNPDNTGAWSIEEFNEYLYVGTMNWDFSDSGGCEVWRSADGLHWEQVVDHGFRPFMSDAERKKEAINTYAWNMKEFQDELYMGTFNARLWLFNEKGTGCQLWKTADGIHWEKVPLPNGMMNDSKDGFGEGENYGIRRMVIYNDELIVGIASSFFHDHGAEIWRFDGTNWFPMISDEIPGATSSDKRYDGFGSSLNKYVWSMVVTVDNKLWVGTANVQVYLPIIYKGQREHSFIDSETHGCELWCFDGFEWQPIIKNDIGLRPNGLGDSRNLGARSMMEYPKDSGNLVIGTFKFLKSDTDEPRDGCELWMRYVISSD